MIVKYTYTCKKGWRAYLRGMDIGGRWFTSKKRAAERVRDRFAVLATGAHKVFVAESKVMTIAGVRYKELI